MTAPLTVITVMAIRSLFDLLERNGDEIFNNEMTI